MEPAPVTSGHKLIGRAELHRTGRWALPVHQLVQGGAVVAALGRLSWLRIYLGRGTPVELLDGVRWRIRATTIGGFVCPVVVDTERRKVAVGTLGNGIYGISGRDLGYSLNPGHKPHRSDAVWLLRHHEVDVAEVRKRPLRFDSSEPVHLGVVLLSLVLIRYGVPDDARLRLPQFKWG